MQRLEWVMLEVNSTAAAAAAAAGCRLVVCTVCNAAPAAELLKHLAEITGRTIHKCLAQDYVCNGSVVVTAYDSEFGRLGSDPEWGAVYYEASITAQG